MKTTALLLSTIFSTACALSLTDPESPSTSLYEEWKTSSSDVTGGDYTNSALLGDVAIHWLIKDEEIYLGVAAGASGWVGFGLADAGRMKGADIVTLESANPDVLVDMYALDNGRPTADASQDWELVSSTVEADFVAFHAKRPLDTMDPQDRVIMNDSQPHTDAAPIIVAWGDSPTLSFHGQNTGRGVVRFFGPPGETVGGKDPLLALVEAAADGSFLVTNRDYSIPLEETHYYDFCLNFVDIPGAPNLNDTVHLIGVDFVPSVEVNGQDTLSHVHHFAAFGAADECESPERFPQFFYGWGPGRPPLIFPEQVGIPMGATGFKSINIEVHYDNRDQTNCRT